MNRETSQNFFTRNAVRYQHEVGRSIVVRRRCGRTVPISPRCASKSESTTSSSTAVAEHSSSLHSSSVDPSSSAATGTIAATATPSLPGRSGRNILDDAAHRHRVLVCVGGPPVLCILHVRRVSPTYNGIHRTWETRHETAETLLQSSKIGRGGEYVCGHQCPFVNVTKSRSRNSRVIGDSRLSVICFSSADRS